MGGGSGSTTWQGLTVGNANSEDINLAANVPLVKRGKNIMDRLL